MSDYPFCRMTNRQYERYERDQEIRDDARRTLRQMIPRLTEKEIEEHVEEAVRAAYTPHPSLSDSERNPGLCR